MRRTTFASFLLAFTLTSSAYAQDDATTKAARARFKEGVDFYDKGQFENARAAFLQAYALKKHPTMLLNLGQSALRSNHPADAAKYLQQYLREAPTMTDAQKRDAESGLAEARTKLGRITISAPTATEITLDGVVIGVTPLSDPLDVEPGGHTLRGKYSDGISDSKSISVSAGEKLSVTLTKDQPAPPEKREAKPPEEPKTAKAPPPEPPANEWKSEGQSPPPVLTSEKPGLLSPPKAMAPFWIGAGVAVAGGGVAIFMASQKSNAETNAKSVERQIRDAGGGKGACASGVPDRYTNACKTLRKNLDLVDTDATLGNVALGVGIAGAVFAVGWYLFSDKKEASTVARVKVLPFVSGEVRGASASLVF